MAHGKGDSNLFNVDLAIYEGEIIAKNIKNTLTTFKNIFLRNHQCNLISNKLDTKYPWVKEIQVLVK